MTKQHILLISIAVGGLSFFTSGCEKWQLDQQVRERCAKDGGIKIYETVKLPPDSFDQWGMVKLYTERQDIKDAYRNDADGIHMEHALGTEYLFKSDDYFYRKGDPAMLRHHYQVIRRSDNRLLGEAVSYGRGGGDLPGPWFPSSYTCPEVALAGPNVLLKAVFIRTNLGG